MTAYAILGVTHPKQLNQDRRRTMKKWRFGIAAIVLMIVVGLFVLNTLQASAHEHREVGDYELTFGWQVEPAFAGVFNGPELFIVDAETQEPVEGAEETLELTVTFGGESKSLTLEPAWQDPGHYVAALTPTRPGDYEFELSGTISGTTAITPTVVAEVFTSADGEFSTIEPASDLLFPDTTLDPVRLQSQIDDLTEEVEALRQEVEALKEEQ
jgi:hypothetical protein